MCTARVLIADECSVPSSVDEAAAPAEEEEKVDEQFCWSGVCTPNVFRRLDELLLEVEAPAPGAPADADADAADASSTALMESELGFQALTCRSLQASVRNSIEFWREGRDLEKATWSGFCTPLAAGALTNAAAAGAASKISLEEASAGNGNAQGTGRRPSASVPGCWAAERPSSGKNLEYCSASSAAGRMKLSGDASMPSRSSGVVAASPLVAVEASKGAAESLAVLLLSTSFEALAFLRPDLFDLRDCSGLLDVFRDLFGRFGERVISGEVCVDLQFQI